MKRSAVPVLLLFACLPLNADVVLEQKMETPKHSGKNVMKIKGDRARLDMESAAGNVTVFLEASGKMTTYIHASKIAVVTTMSEDQLKAKALLKKAGVEPQKPGAPKPTGETEKFGGWNCEIWQSVTPAVTVKQWRTKEIPNLPRIIEQMKFLTLIPGMGMDEPDTDFLTVKTERSDAKGTSTVTVLKISEEPLPDSDYTPLEGYREVVTPAK